MRIQRCYRLIALLLLLPSGLFTAARSQQSAPSLVVTVRTTTDSPPNTLAIFLVDALQGIVFYTDPDVDFVKALEWSPKGNYLAILKATWAPYMYSAALCILNRSGVEQSCFQEPLRPFPAEGPDLNRISWSANEKLVYFITEDSGQLILVAGDALSGEVTRSLYQYTLKDAEYEDLLPAISWSSDLRYVMVGAGNNVRAFYDLPTVIAELTSNTEIDSAIFSKSMDDVEICPQFSPSGSYLTVLAKDGHNNELSLDSRRLLIVDMVGTVHNIVDRHSGLGELRMTCAQWAQDETTIFFFGNTLQPYQGHVFRYSLVNAHLEDYYAIPRGDGTTIAESVRPPLAVSPDGTLLALGSSFNPKGKYKQGVSVIVMFPDRHMELILGDFFTADYPVWVIDNT